MVHIHASRTPMSTITGILRHGCRGYSLVLAAAENIGREEEIDTATPDAVTCSVDEQTIVLHCQSVDGRVFFGCTTEDLEGVVGLALVDTAARGSSEEVCSAITLSAHLEEN